MKKIFLILILLLSIFVLKVDGYVKTGHDDFMEINFLDKNDKLLVNRTTEEISNAYKTLNSFKLFGWKTYYFNINSPATYVGDIIFSRSNRTNNVFKMSYKLNSQNYSDKSLKVNGSVSSKITFGDKSKVDATITPTFGVTYDDRNTSSKEEITNFDLTIAPNTRISLRITGDAYVTSGVSKYHFLGICFRKGEWERVDVETIYYELFEEKL